MAVSVGAVMRHCRNFFERDYLDGTFRITGNALPEADGANFVYISGSMAHDGVWEVHDGCLSGGEIDYSASEEFEGRIWFLAPPLDFLELVETIKAYEEKNPVGALVQERFGEYSYMRNMRSGADTGWATAFKNDLAQYRHMYTEVC